LKDKIKKHYNMFRIVCDPSSGNTELYLTEIRSVVFPSPSYRTHTHTYTHTHTHTPLVQNYAAKHRPSTWKTSV